MSYIRILPVAGLCVATLALAACGGAGDATRSGGDADAGFGGEPSGSIEVMGFNTPDEVATTRVDLFNSHYPDVTVNIAEGALDEQVFLSAVSAGNPPDLIQMPSGQVGSFAARGALMPLDECISERDFDMSQYREELTGITTYEDASYGIPEFYNAPVLIVNNVALKEAGLTLDDVSIADQDKLMALATALTTTENGKITRLGVALRIPELMPLYGYVDGNPWVQGAEDIRLDDPATVATFERLRDVQDAMGGQAAIEDTINAWDFWGEGNPFATNQIGVQVIEQWYVNVLAATSPDVDVTVLPITRADGEQVTQATSNVWGIPKGATNPAAACEFIKVVTDSAAWEAAAQARLDLFAEQDQDFTGIFTGNKNAEEVIFGELYDPSTVRLVWADAVEAIRESQDSAKVDPATPIGAPYTTAWQEAANAVLKGEASAPDALAGAQGKVDEALASVQD